jgi:ferrochelatase
MANPSGILLINLGTPRSYRPKDVFSYLNEFLTDGRVIDFPWFQRQILSRGLIVPFRFRQSAELYRHLWTEEGSPLLLHGEAVKTKLQEELGASYLVALAMRYQEPSIEKGLKELQKARVKEIIVFPLFPQYASATTGSVHQKVMELVSRWEVIPQMSFVNSYADHPALIEAFCERAKQYCLEKYDHVLFSFHGLPERHLHKADAYQRCLTSNCCEKLVSQNRFCYKAQCHATARAIADKLQLRNYTICFQSRLGKDPWVQPYTMDRIKQSVAQGLKRLLVFCPSFVCDCLETTCEISYEYNREFKQLGGEEIQLVEGLNSHPLWIKCLKTIVLEHSFARG